LPQERPHRLRGLGGHRVMVLARHLQRGVFAEHVRQREHQGQQQHGRNQDVFPACVFEHVQALFRLPLGISWAIWTFCTLTRTPSAISSVTKVSPTSVTRPSRPPVVTTSSPAASFDTSAWCSWASFCSARISMT